MFVGWFRCLWRRRRLAGPMPYLVECWCLWETATLRIPPSRNPSIRVAGKMLGMLVGEQRWAPCWPQAQQCRGSAGVSCWWSWMQVLKADCTVRRHLITRRSTNPELVVKRACCPDLITLAWLRGMGQPQQLVVVSQCSLRPLARPQPHPGGPSKGRQGISLLLPQPLWLETER